jgi:integrase
MAREAGNCTAYQTAHEERLRLGHRIGHRTAGNPCAARTGELIQATWKEVDFEKKLWTRPASHMKAKKEHQIPLAPRAIEILRNAKKISDGSEYLFPGLRAGRPLSNMTFNMTLRRMGRSNITAHGFRSSFRDWAQDRTHHKRHTIETALAHVLGDKTEAAYLRTQALEERRELMNAWERFCTSKATAKLVKSRRQMEP